MNRIFIFGSTVSKEGSVESLGTKQEDTSNNLSLWKQVPLEVDTEERRQLSDFTSYMNRRIQVPEETTCYPL